MFKKLIERAAAKASLANIKFDLDQLAESFPHNSSRTSNAIFKLLENITLAFSNNASEAEVEQVLIARSAAFPTVLKEIITEIFKLIVATRHGDSAAVSAHDSRINNMFHASTGTYIDITKVPWLSKLALTKVP
ncbi:MAG TPA: hypothetical protein VKC61_14360 [Pyrinomonadaceae bacterium]|nr:hypothetical protein [Pyrinomonadaceae bacterium]